MVSARAGLASGSALLAALLTVLAVAGTIGAVALAGGALCGACLGGAIRRGLAHDPTGSLGPADLVTGARSILGCGIAALVIQQFIDARSGSGLLVPLAVVALVLDGVDGRIARRTGTTSRFGARFDGEADAFLLLVLSVHLVPTWGAWVLAIGLARYVFAAAGWFLPWLRRELPFRYWRKVVTAVQGIVLTYAAAAVGPPASTYVALAVALGLLAESFGRDVLWTWRRRRASQPLPGAPRWTDAR